MSRVAGFLSLVFFVLPFARADEVAWTAADQAQLTALAKKAKKNGEMFTVTGDVFEARLPTREAAAEFCLYFERLAERIRPLWGTRENTTKVVAIAMHPKDKAWPADASGQKIAFESVPTKQQPDVPMQVASIHVWVHPDLAADALALAAIPRADLNRVGLNALLTRLAGRNPRPAWFDDGLQSTFAIWSPVMPEGDAGRLDAATREPSVIAAMKEACAAKDPLDALLPALRRDEEARGAHGGRRADLRVVLRVPAGTQEGPAADRRDRDEPVARQAARGGEEADHQARAAVAGMGRDRGRGEVVSGAPAGARFIES
jgi:hypothetical protein